MGKIAEWKDKFNSFNSDKIYLHGGHLQTIANWLEGKGTLPAPIEISFDPIHACNLMCQHCNAHRYLVGNNYRMTNQHLMELVEFFAKWGVKAICFGGGGESTLHTKIGEAIELSYKLGMENSLVTNGTVLTPDMIKTIVRCCRYVGISVDSASSEVYKIGRKVELFNETINNIDSLVKTNKQLGTHCDIAYKFLIFGYNQHEIFKACKLAKSLGVKDFHVRPADFKHQGMGDLKKTNSEYNVDFINNEFEKCHAIEDENFRVFTVIHKFNKDFTPQRNFTQCYASPIAMQICADGNIYFCPDTRFVEFFKLGTHINIEDIPKFWGGERHKELVSKLGCAECKSRCTYAPYNEACERLFINIDDPMIRNLI